MTQIQGKQISNNSIDTNKIVDGAVETSDLKDDCVTVNKLAHNIDASGINFNSAKVGGKTVDDTQETTSVLWTAGKIKNYVANNSSGQANGTPIRLATLNIATINTNTTLYTVPAGNFIRNATLTAVNKNNLNAKIRIAHSLGSVQNKDYICYDLALNSKKQLNFSLNGISENEIITVYSNRADVNFVLTGGRLTTNPKEGKLSALDIDGTVNLTNADYIAYSANGSIISFFVCNRSGSLARVRAALIDGAIGTLSTDEYILYEEDIKSNESRTFDLKLNMANGHSLTFRSDTANVNIVVYGAYGL